MKLPGPLLVVALILIARLIWPLFEGPRVGVK